MLKLDDYSLKKYVDLQPKEPESPGAFAEFPSTAEIHASECVLEFEDVAGASLRVHLKGAAPLDAVAPGRQLQQTLNVPIGLIDNAWGGSAAEVRSDDIAIPVAVRYAWADNPLHNVQSREGLPMTLFRTDDWPGVTADVVR